MNKLSLAQQIINLIRGAKDIDAALNGIKDELITLFTDKEVTLAHSLARGLNECEPLSNHVDELSLSVMSKAIKNADYKSAESAIRAGTKEGAIASCVEILVSAAMIACDKCPSILRDALPQAAAGRFWGIGKR